MRSWAGVHLLGSDPRGLVTLMRLLRDPSASFSEDAGLQDVSALGTSKRAADSSIHPLFHGCLNVQQALFELATPISDCPLCIRQKVDSAPCDLTSHVSFLCV